LLTRDEIANALPSDTFTYAEKWSRAKLDEAVQDLCADAHTILEDVAVSKRKKTENVTAQTVDHVLDHSSTAPSLDVHSTLTSLMMNDIKTALPSDTFTHAEKRSRKKLEDAVHGLPAGAQRTLEDVAVSKKQKTEQTIAQAIEHVHDPSTDSENFFFQTVSEECRQRCIANFIDSTGTAATTTSVCAVCAGRFFSWEIHEVKVSDLNKENLRPSKPHPAHILTDEMLLHCHSSSLRTDASGQSIANVCTSCNVDLQHEKTPVLSLANGMWIGDVPLELKVLTLPERILVARYFPAAYIVKLYPRQKGARTWATTGLHSGLQGNVSMYRLNTDDIAKMTSRKSPILATNESSIGTDIEAVLRDTTHNGYDCVHVRCLVNKNITRFFLFPRYPLKKNRGGTI
jgi:hypothetical protein